MGEQVQIQYWRTKKVDSLPIEHQKQVSCSLCFLKQRVFKIHGITTQTSMHQLICYTIADTAHLLLCDGERICIYIYIFLYIHIFYIIDIYIYIVSFLESLLFCLVMCFPPPSSLASQGQFMSERGGDWQLDEHVWSTGDGWEPTLLCTGFP